MVQRNEDIKKTHGFVQLCTPSGKRLQKKLIIIAVVQKDAHRIHASAVYMIRPLNFVVKSSVLFL